MLENEELGRILAQIKLVICDVDGVLTDGGLYIGKGEELKRYNSRDGSGIKYLMRNGVEVAFLTGRQSDSVERRAAELGIKHVRQGAKKKLPVYIELVESLGVKYEETMFVGDDLVDLPPMRASGIGVAVVDAAPEVYEHADYVTLRAGGQGAMREVVELILRAQGKWDPLVDSYLEQTVT